MPAHSGGSEDGSSDDDAIFLAALEMAEQQQRNGQSGQSCGPDSAQDMQHQQRGGRNEINIENAGATDAENKLRTADLTRVQTLKQELAKGGKANDALVANVAKLKAAIVKVQGEHNAEKEKVRALEGNMMEAGDLGKKLKEKEAELEKVEEEMGAMKKDWEAQLSSATKEWKVSSEALKSELYSVSEERDMI